MSDETCDHFKGIVTLALTGLQFCGICKEVLRESYDDV